MTSSKVPTIYNIKEFKHKTRGKTNAVRYFARKGDYGKKLKRELKREWRN
jgi:hypothetical protein